MTHRADFVCPLNCESKHGGTFVTWLARWVCSSCYGHLERELACPGVHHGRQFDGRDDA